MNVKMMTANWKRLWMGLPKKLKMVSVPSVEKSKISKEHGRGFVDYVPGSYRGLTDPAEIVMALVGKGFAARKNEQSFNILVVVPTLALLFAIPYFYVRAMGWASQSTQNRADEMRISTVEIDRGRMSGGVIGFVPTMSGKLREDIQIVQDVTEMPLQEATATLQHATATPGVKYEQFSYTWYNPGLGSVNCWEWSEEMNTCLSMTASGEDWRLWFGRGLACPVEYPFYTKFIVSSPSELIGEYVCIDRGAAIVGSRLDFLDESQRVPWDIIIEAEVILP